MAAADATPTSRSARFPSRLEETSALLAWFSQVQPPSLDPLIWVQAQTALVEGFTNAVRHAHAPLASPPAIEVDVAYDATGLRIRIRDHGPFFDIPAVWRALEDTADGAGGSEPADPTALPERESHWGLIMLLRLHRQHGWSIHYDPLPEGGNVLVLQKPLC
ncbi:MULTISPECIES: ATP-binding protein [Aphanothece]|uniref:ATP-binding protein n=1 Tax=Aphanothece TaxID=1121 RepID=UPI00398503FA